MAAKKGNTATSLTSLRQMRTRLRRALELLEEMPEDEKSTVGAVRALVRWTASDVEELERRIHAVTEPLPVVLRAA
jgi:hypothetical protein